MPTSSQQETIDLRILRLLGLEDVFDLDYETYLTLLKEAMVKGRMTNKAIPTEEVELLTNEYKRVKSRKDAGRFKVKKKRITAKSISSTSFPKLKTTKIKAPKLLPGAPAESFNFSSSSSGIEKIFEDISSSVSSILNVLKEQKKIRDKTAEYERKRGERARRRLQESNLEKRFSGLSKTVEKIVGPVKSILDRILDFLLTIVIGRVLYKIINWFGNPKNQSKVNSVIRFLSDHGPKLLGLYLLFGTRLGRFSVRLAATLIKGAIKLGAASIRLFTSLPGWAKAAVVGAGLFSFGAVAGSIPGAVDQDSDEVKAYASGGQVSGPSGIDKVPAMLTDGEFVMSKGAVQKYGLSVLEAMNAAGGGTNVPMISDEVVYAQGGGYIEGKERVPAFGLRPDLNIGSSIPSNISGIDRHIMNVVNRYVIGDQSFLNKLALSMQGKGGGVSMPSLGGMNLEGDITKLAESGYQFGAGVYNQIKTAGENVLNSGQLEKSLNSIKNAPSSIGSGLFGSVEKSASSQGYKDFAKRSNELQDKAIGVNDKFIKALPPGPMQEIADKGLIPIPTGNAAMMRNLTFVKAMLGPLGKPFKLLSNKEVDKMRQMTIDKTMSKHGLIVDPKTGQVKMNWNQEDINKGAKGGGAYTDDLGPGGKKFNSILGRFVAKTEDGGSTLYTDDRYNFNKTVAEYAGMAKEQLMKGSIGEAAYFGASMLGRFAQDIGWLNQRALGSKIKIGDIDKTKLDAKTGKPKTAAQLKEDAKKLVAKSFTSPTVAPGGVGPTLTPQQVSNAKLAKTKPKVNLPAPPAKPKPIVTSTTSQRRKNRRGGKPNSTSVPNINASSSSKSKTKILGIPLPF